MKTSPVFMADLLTGFAYFAIPAALLFIVRPARSVLAKRVLWYFALFILFCGTTHFIDAWYNLRGICANGEPIQKLFKWATAIMSILTVAAIIPHIRTYLAVLERELDRSEHK